MNIHCDRCERVFEAPPEHAGGKMPCPYCGDINRIPANGAPAAPSAAPAAPTAPSATGDLPPQEAPETHIRTVRKAMFRAHPFRYMLIVLLFAAGVTLSVAARPMEQLSDWLLWPGLVLAALALAMWVWWWITATLWVRLKLTNKRTIWSEGIIRRHTSEVLHDHVRNVAIRQRFMQRLFNVGYLGISSAGQDGIEIEVHDIPRPYEVKAIIDRYRKM